ncbi:NAD-dependent epimerase [Candidatus Marinamargulisbacteria bacterium SCGC AG-410-N11]|nr:NAD-dependent epimerase [Candidatus Marinamargulisbacteria bacterium SCGC AG-410-N11]
MDKKKVLITGISGWIAQFCAVELIKSGFKVKGSLRDMSRKKEVQEALAKKVDIKDSLEFCELDLLKDHGWDEAMSDCTYVMHVASPFVMLEPDDENELIEPAKEGTLRALRAAKKAKIKRVVITSSIAAMAAHIKVGRFDPSSWTNLTNKVTAYEKSKTIAEKAAWDFIENQKGDHKLELTVINPGGVMGPTLSPDIKCTSLDICVQLLTKKMPAIPNISFTMVDVRDVAKHHLQAMTHEKANGKRIISANETPTSMRSIAMLLKENGYDVPTKKLPTFMVKLMGLFDKQAKGMIGFLDRHVTCDNSETISLFNWKPTPLDKSFLDMAKSVQNVLDQQKNQ